ncbi:MAG TPA: MBL fold metallo-hydrolase, partial [Polyangiaceae bacterium]|nr:MBL fold metallo-hydrolase [Polyangiaceae bacterium]
MGSFYIKQLLVGRDVAVGDQIATGMQNFVYLVGDGDAKECLIIDPAWDVAGVLGIAQAEGFRVVGALATHYHPDHIGGSMFGFSVEGLAKLQELAPCPV